MVRSPTFEYHDDGRVTVMFAAISDLFAAASAAERWLRDRGFSVGRMQSGSPRGIMFGEFDIRKWRDLNPIERVGLHGLMTGDGNECPISIEIFADAPLAAREAIVAAPDRLPQASVSSTHVLDLVADAAMCGMLFFIFLLGLALFGPGRAPTAPAPIPPKITLRVDPQASNRALNTSIIMTRAEAAR